MSDDAYVDALDRFVTWLESYSPLYAELRTPVAVHEGAPLRLRQFWEKVGWAPGVGIGYSLRPERHVTRRATEKAFEKWLALPDFAESRQLPERSKKALWERFPARTWVLFVDSSDPRHEASYVDEDAGDDPPLLKSNGKPPTLVAPHAVASLMSSTINGQSWNRRVHKVSLVRPPDNPGLFAPVLDFWELAPGVWTTGDRIIFRAPGDYVDYLLSVPEQEVKGLGSSPQMTLFTLEDLKLLNPERLAVRGFRVIAGHAGAVSAVGRFDGMPLIVHGHGTGKPSGFVYVTREDEPRFRALMKAEKLKSYDTQKGHENPVLHPSDKDRELARRLFAEATGAPKAAAAASKRGQPKGKVLPAPPEELEAVKREASALRARLVAGRPNLQLASWGQALREDEPPLVRAFWEAVGWEEELREVAGYPDRDSSELALRETLDDYKSWGAPITRSKLPKRQRLLQIDSQGLGLTLTDETEPAHDPPVLGASTDSGKVEMLNPSYLRYVGEQIAGFAFQAFPGYEVSEQVARTLREENAAAVHETPLPRLVPALRRLGPGVHLAPRWPMSGARVVGDSLADLVDWLVGPGAAVAPPLSFKSVGGHRIDVPRFRSEPALTTLLVGKDGGKNGNANGNKDGGKNGDKDGEPWQVGRLDGVPILVCGSTLHCDRAAEEIARATALVASRNWG